jgi:FkbM family methyltransferase
MRPREGKINQVIETFSKIKKDIFFIQIGSNDGIAGDPIHQYISEHNWSGILVEPIKYVFERLLHNYTGYPRLIFENVAIADQTGSRQFWYLQETEENLPAFYDQLGSFDPEVILKHAKAIPDIKKYLVTEYVKCLTLSDLIKKHRVTKIDLFHLDTEGYDFDIIMQIDFHIFNPHVILFEHKHLSPKDSKHCAAYLNGNGYKLIVEAGNTAAYKF